MILALLAACTEPGTLGSVSDALGAGALADAELPIRTTTAIVGLLAETCGADTLEDYRFTGRSAAALRATAAVVTREDAAQTWTFDGVGLDGAEGTLALVTDLNQQNFAVSYAVDGVRLSAGLELRACEEAGASAIVGGTGTWTTADVVVGLTVLGAAPTNGLGFVPTTADVPSSGQVRAEVEAADWVVLMDDAATAPDGAPVWKGVATGSDWASEVEVRWP